METTIKWGIIGLGSIAHKFVKDLLLVEKCTLEAVASRNLKKAESFSKQYNATSFYNSYEALFKNLLVDIVYIATPNNSHKLYTVLALEHKKAVLCEKPFAINKKQVYTMIEASKNNNTFLMEAMWSRFIPSIKKIKNSIDSGEIGEVKYINADFSFKANTSIQRIYDKELGGGSLLDIGIYPVFLAYLLLGIPTKINANAHYYKSGADSQLAMLFNYKNAQAILFSSFNSTSKRVAKISGTLGEIIINEPWNETNSFTIQKNNEEASLISLPTVGKGFSHEIVECTNCLLENKIESTTWSHQNSLDLITLLDAIRKEINLTYKEDL
ncbi:MAG: gfo/Idh/MocA family oxidoreductase [Lutibacter sp.]|uniref:Gfo/Idh/MocA family protein n=1 Tax=Lutibacter sp. TaxID=1925666 RepID=UPI001A074A84|nr:Gfo/Idh/MocA family oxidoreductase [Lutibacter sp.]NOR28004.1 gfo/Idh/MocA family oxidoreductase [Lutibacter sp.]